MVCQWFIAFTICYFAATGQTALLCYKSMEREMSANAQPNAVSTARNPNQRSSRISSSLWDLQDGQLS